MPIVANEHKEALKDNGFCIVPDVLSRAEAAAVRAKLVAAAAESERRGMPTYIPTLDPNDANVRVFNLIDLDPVFQELITHPSAIDLVTNLLGEGFIISNFTANIARPGSQSMAIHSDLGVVLPEPWHAPWSMNIIWCLDDVHAANGATLYLPGSHHITHKDQLPGDREEQLVPFEAPAGAIIAMDGRVWHTSGENKTKDEERALLFGYYSADFIRPQTNWSAALSEETKATIEPPLFDWLGLGPNANVRQGAALVQNLPGRNV